MNFTTNPLRPAMTSPTNASSQNTDSSQEFSWMSKNLTKWRISAQEGSCKPHELEDKEKCILVRVRRKMRREWRRGEGDK